MSKIKIQEGIEQIVRDSIDLVEDNLKGIILFGSMNNDDFVEGISDVDLIYILGKIDTNSLNILGGLRNAGKQYTGCKVDIKPFTLSEFNAAVRGISSFEFFTGWGLEMIRSGKQRCLYHSSELSLEYTIDKSRLKKDALERAHYYITKLRKVISSDEQLLIRGERRKVEGNEFLKVAASSVKNVLRFCLAYRRIVTDDCASILVGSTKYLGNVEDIALFLSSRNNNSWNQEMMFKAYDQVEQIYRSVIENG
ncbi:MAG: nucleotidyltransferase domain-containing protein [Candidatus Woesearchaeota archaeon]